MHPYLGKKHPFSPAVRATPCHRTGATLLKTENPDSCLNFVFLYYNTPTAEKTGNIQHKPQGYSIEEFEIKNDIIFFI